MEAPGGVHVPPGARNQCFAPGSEGKEDNNSAVTEGVILILTA